WQKFQPHPEWASFVADKLTSKPAPGQPPAHPSYGPFSTGSEKVRLIYVPELRAIHVKNLEPNTRYRARIFNPVSGKSTDLGDLTLDDKSGWTAAAPSQSDADDWALIVEHGR